MAMDEFQDIFSVELALGKIDRMKFEKVAARIAKKHHVDFHWDEKYNEIVFTEKEE